MYRGVHLHGVMFRLIKHTSNFTFITGSNGRAGFGAVGWGTALRAWGARVRFPMASLKFFFNVFLPHYGRRVESPSNRNKYQKYLPGGNAADTYSWQPYHLHLLIILKYGILSLLELSSPVQARIGIDLPLQTVRNEQPGSSLSCHLALCILRT